MSSPTTYNPQERSFIKRPEQKCCAACGQPLPSDVKPISNHMNNYIAATEGAKMAVFNSNEETLKIDGVTLYKVGSKAHLEAAKPKVPVTLPAGNPSVGATTPAK